MLQKYTLLKEDSITLDGVELFRIKALIDFDDVKAGHLGGYIQSYNNLSQEGNCWVYQLSKVMHKALVCENAKIKSTLITDNAVISGSAYSLYRMVIGGNVKMNSNNDVLYMSLMNPISQEFNEQFRDDQFSIKRVMAKANDITLAKNYVAIYPHVFSLDFIFKGTSAEFRDWLKLDMNRYHQYKHIVKILDTLQW